MFCFLAPKVVLTSVIRDVIIDANFRLNTLRSSSGIPCLNDRRYLLIIVLLLAFMAHTVLSCWTVSSLPATGIERLDDSNAPVSPPLYPLNDQPKKNLYFNFGLIELKEILSWSLGVTELKDICAIFLVSLNWRSSRV